MGNSLPGDIIGHPVTGEHTYAGTWSSRFGDERKTMYLWPVKEILLRNPMKWKPDAVWQNSLKKPMAQNGLFCQCDCDIMSMFSKTCLFNGQP
jgi:hypothetical protein